MEKCQRKEVIADGAKIILQEIPAPVRNLGNVSVRV